MAEHEPSLFNRGLASGLFKGLLTGLVLGALVAATVVAITAGPVMILGAGGAAAAVWSAVTGGGWASIAWASAGIPGLKGAVIAGAAVAGFVATGKMLGDAGRIRNEEAVRQRHLRKLHERAGRNGSARGLEQEAEAPEQEIAEALQASPPERTYGPSEVEKLRERDAQRRADGQSAGLYA